MKNKNNNIKKFSTIGFIMSSIGAAVGLGNIWRFPKEMVTSGGSSFILIYIVVLFLVAFPIILLEMQYGLFFKKGVVSCFKNVSKKVGRFFGWKQVVITLFSCVYYLAIISWIFVGFFYALDKQIFSSWSKEKNFFEERILQLPKENETFTFSYLTLIGFVVLLFLLYLIISLGVKKGLEKTNIFLVPGLFFLLIGLTIYSLVQPNSKYAIKKLFEFKSKNFSDLEVWRKATIQVIFSTGILFGTYMILGKNSDIKIDKGNDAFIIISADTFSGILSGILITTTVANGFFLKGIIEEKQVLENLDIFFKKETSGGSSLIFNELPKVFQNFKIQWLGQLLFIFFIISLFFAAFSSIIFLIEVFVDSVVEFFPKISRKKIILFWTFFALIQYIFYIFFNQVKVIDYQDVWINQLILFIGCYEIIKFVNYKKYKQIFKENEKYTYIKFTKFNWLKRMILFVTFPIILFITIYGFFKLFDLDYYIFSNASKNIKDFLINYFKLNVYKKPETILKPYKIFTFITIFFYFLIPFILWLKTKKKELKRN